VELDDQLRLLGFNIQHGMVVQEEEEEPPYHFTTYHSGASSNSYQDDGASSSHHEGATSWPSWPSWDWSPLRPKAYAWGEVRRRFTHLHIIFCRTFVYSCFTFSSVLVLISTFPKHKKTKNISIVSLYLVLWFSTFGLLYLLFSVCYLKNPKIFCFVCYFLLLLFQKLKTPKIFVVLLRFCKVVAEFSSPLLHWSLVFTLYYSSRTSEEQ
jgi:hypothetical protein